MSLLLLESDQSDTAKVPATRHYRVLSERVKNAARVTAPIFLVAIVGALIPVVHFVLVPGALIAMIWFGAREMTTLHSYTVTELKCPHCQAPYGETELARLPKRLTCFSCRVASTLTVSSDS